MKSEMKSALLSMYPNIITHKESNVLGSKGPRKMHIILPKLQSNDFPVEFKPSKDVMNRN